MDSKFCGQCSIEMEGEPSPWWSRGSGAESSRQGGGAQADQRAAALPIPVPLCRHHDQAVSAGPGTVRLHTSGRILTSRWHGRSAAPAVLVHGPVVVAVLTVLCLLHREHFNHGWSPSGNRKWSVSRHFHPKGASPVRTMPLFSINPSAGSAGPRSRWPCRPRIQHRPEARAVYLSPDVGSACMRCARGPYTVPQPWACTI